MVIDVWMQHPTLRFLGNDIFESLRRWTGQEVPDEQLPIDATVAAMDDAGVNFGLLSAWSAPHQPPLISNEEVADWVSAQPTPRGAPRRPRPSCRRQPRRLLGAAR